MGEVISLRGFESEEAVVSALVELKNHCIEATILRRRHIRSSFCPAAHFCRLLLARLDSVDSRAPCEWQLVREDAKRLLHRLEKLNRSPDVYTPAIERHLMIVENTCVDLEFGCEPLLERSSSNLVLVGLQVSYDLDPA